MTPVEIDGRLLVDGGVVRNLPIDVARSLGAQVVIAVNIGTPLLERKEITSLLSVSDQLTRILTVNNVNQSLKELTPDDVLITPDLGDVADRRTSIASPTRLRRARRRRARWWSAWRAGRSTPRRYAALTAARTATGASSDVRIQEVRVEGLKRVNEDVVRAAMQTQPGGVFNAASADNDMRRIYGRGDFERVSYFLTELPGGGHAMTTDVGEKAWGPHYLRLGFGLSTDFEGNSFFNLLLTHRWTWLNRLGAEWRNDVQIGHTERLRTEWHQPLTSAQRWFVAGHAELARDPFDFFDEQGRRARALPARHPADRRRRRRAVRQRRRGAARRGARARQARHRHQLRARLRRGAAVEHRWRGAAPAPRRARQRAPAACRLCARRCGCSARTTQLGADEAYSRLEHRRAGCVLARAACAAVGRLRVACDQRRPAFPRVVEPGRLSATVGLPDRRVHRARRALRPT